MKERIKFLMEIIRTVAVIYIVIVQTLVMLHLTGVL